MRRFFPRSLLGQMLLAVALALLVAQALSAILQFRAAEQRREMYAANQLAFQLIADPRFDYRLRNDDSRIPGDDKRRRWQRLRVERTSDYPLMDNEQRDAAGEELLRRILSEQGIEPAELIVTRRRVADDDYVMRIAQRRGNWTTAPEWTQDDMLVAGLRRVGEDEYTVARFPYSDRGDSKLGSLVAQTLVLYIVLVGGLALLLRRITRPLAALTTRVETFAATRAIDGQIEPSGPEDTRRLIAAHNAMERRIAALLDEKDVMLGAIGHDLKTPLAALRVRIESVENDTEREKMAATIEDITSSLDDILSLARVGRPSDPLERTDLSALLSSVVEEYEDMGSPVELGATRRMAMRLRATWLRRALRNLISNALRYGETARVSLQRENGEAVIRIEDDGPGIPEGEIAAMMEPFSRGEASRNRVTGGAGLGLTLARAIAEQHGGSLTLRNRIADGAQIVGLVAELRLPLD
ncbi:signal transduction histidine kinase [Altererythrobacter atlanticus]|uniref:histidine kinase n=1 Tax=Croceibacterium atlanticum TaxID=1267766 RepID=A0A0F7KV48_9SPHN|nr:ATP-binding protein [Croceibacterium atlanticum]AKH43112.1 Osmolarity sensor protein EnvZ [Croceibacterium atlanticum]MBB5732184.1 signal transduction histidine kinase [Croceibacterium atlanticum]